jgi:hypothetical protein
MTAIAGFILALIAGLAVTRSQAARWVILPWVGVLAVQTTWLAAGRGNSPASSVTRFPDFIGYIIVQLVSLGLATWAANRIAERRKPSSTSDRLASPRSRVTATAVAAASALAILAATAPAHPGHPSTGGPIESLSMLALLGCLAIGGTLAVLRRARPSNYARTQS